MNNKQAMLTMLGEEFKRWEALLSRLSEEQITAAQPSGDLSIQDQIAHLMAWQQVSIARLQAAQTNQQPVLPAWLAGLDPDSEEDTEQFNGRIYATYHDQPWSQVQQDWRAGFLRFLQLSEAIPENELMEPEKYGWLNGYALFAVLEGSYGHHQEHFESLLV